MTEQNKMQPGDRVRVRRSSVVGRVVMGGGNSTLVRYDAGGSGVYRQSELEPEMSQPASAAESVELEDGFPDIFKLREYAQWRGRGIDGHIGALARFALHSQLEAGKE